MTKPYLMGHVTTLIDIVTVFIQEMRREKTLTPRERTVLNTLEDIQAELLGVRATVHREESTDYE